MKSVSIHHMSCILLYSALLPGLSSAVSPVQDCTEVVFQGEVRRITESDNPDTIEDCWNLVCSNRSQTGYVAVKRVITTRKTELTIGDERHEVEGEQTDIGGSFEGGSGRLSLPNGGLEAYFRCGIPECKVVTPSRQGMVLQKKIDEFCWNVQCPADHQGTIFLPGNLTGFTQLRFLLRRKTFHARNQMIAVNKIPPHFFGKYLDEEEEEHETLQLTPTVAPILYQAEQLVQSSNPVASCIPTVWPECREEVHQGNVNFLEDRCIRVGCPVDGYIRAERTLRDDPLVSILRRRFVEEQGGMDDWDDFGIERDFSPSFKKENIHSGFDMHIRVAPIYSMRRVFPVFWRCYESEDEEKCVDVRPGVDNMTLDTLSHPTLNKQCWTLHCPPEATCNVHVGSLPSGAQLIVRDATVPRAANVNWEFSGTQQLRMTGVPPYKIVSFTLSSNMPHPQTLEPVDPTPEPVGQTPQPSAGSGNDLVELMMTFKKTGSKDEVVEWARSLALVERMSVLFFRIAKGAARFDLQQLCLPDGCSALSNRDIVEDTESRSGSVLNSPSSAAGTVDFHFDATIPETLEDELTSALHQSFHDEGLDSISVTRVTPNKESSDDSLSSGAIVGIVVGCVAGVLLLGAIAFFILRRKSSSPKAGDVESPRHPDTEINKQ